MLIRLSRGARSTLDGSASPILIAIARNVIKAFARVDWRMKTVRRARIASPDSIVTKNSNLQNANQSNCITIVAHTMVNNANLALPALGTDVRKCSSIKMAIRGSLTQFNASLE